MWNYLWACKSRYAKGWLIGAVIVQFAFGMIAAAGSTQDLFGNWTVRDLTVLLSMTTLLVSAVLMHGFDEHRHGWGFVDVYQRYGAFHERREQNFVPSVLSAESIRAAITTVILAALLDNRESFVSGEAKPHEVLTGKMFADPRTVVFFLVIGALAFSLLTTMAGLLCYEYASRFTWEDDSPKIDLLRKAFRFGTWGFYCLMWSLAVVPALVDHYLGFISIFLVFVVMWLYYFFPMKDQGVPPRGFEICGEIRHAETLDPCESMLQARLGRAYASRHWSMRSGEATIKVESGARIEVILHWHEADGIGRREWKIRRIMDPSGSDAASAERHPVICKRNDGYLASLEPLKVYVAHPDALADRYARIRVVDESGESYLFPTDYFVVPVFDAATRAALANAL